MNIEVWKLTKNSTLCYAMRYAVAGKAGSKDKPTSGTYQPCPPSANVKYQQPGKRGGNIFF